MLRLLWLETVPVSAGICSYFREVIHFGRRNETVGASMAAKGLFDGN
jgi:hypothetical protein